MLLLLKIPPINRFVGFFIVRIFVERVVFVEHVLRLHPEINFVAIVVLGGSTFNFLVLIVVHS